MKSFLTYHCVRPDTIQAPRHSLVFAKVVEQKDDTRFQYKQYQNLCYDFGITPTSELSFIAYKYGKTTY